MIRDTIVALAFVLGALGCVGGSDETGPTETGQAPLKRDCTSDADCGIYCPSCGQGECGGIYEGECHCDQSC